MKADITIPTNEDLAKIMADTGLTGSEFGEAIGYSDAERTTRALLKGERHGKPYAMSGTAARSLAYMMALHRLVAAHADYRIDMTPDTEEALVKALEDAARILPKRLQPKDLPA